MTNFEVRQLETVDYPRLAEIYNSNYPEYNLSPDEIRYDDEAWDYERYIQKQMTATISGRVEAFAAYWHSPIMYHPRKFSMTIMVDPAKQRSRIGSALYAQILTGLQPLNAILVRSRTRADQAGSKSFLQNRGFREITRDWESRLPVDAFSAEPFKHYAEQAASSGVTITTLAEEAKRDPDCYRKLYEIWFEKVGHDLPLPDAYTPTSFEDFMTRIIKGPSMLPEGCFIAKLDGRYVGISCCGKTEREPNDLYQWMTGVLREYRGKGIAISMKLRVIDFAARNGYHVIKTWNNSANEAMLAINHKLGYQRHVGWVTFEKTLN